jgi:hypothetical protein
MKGSSNHGSGSGSSALRQLGFGGSGGFSSGKQAKSSQSGSSGPQNGNKGNGNHGFHIRIAIGHVSSYRHCTPVVIVPGPEVLFAPEAVPTAEIVSGGVVELPGDWGRQEGYACLMVGEEYAYFKVLEWTEKGVKLGVPNVDLKSPLEATLQMVRFDRSSFPTIPVKVLPPVAEAPSAIVDASKVDASKADASKTGAVKAEDSAVPPASGKTTQSSQVTPAADASNAPADPDDGGTFGQLEQAAGAKDSK